jgi:hypothetical protein
MSDDTAREWVRNLFNTTEAAPLPVPETVRHTTGPVIPGQERQPAPRPSITPEQRWVNTLFNAGTAREHY